MKRRQILSFIIISGLTIPLIHCTKEAERDFARVRTLEASNVNEYGATINGEVLNFKTAQVEECGFYLYTGEPSESTFAGAGVADFDNKSGQFSYTIETGLLEGNVYYYEAYAKIDPVLTVGNQMSFRCEGDMSPATPVDFFPETGQAGDTIALNFDTEIVIYSGFTVDFNGVNANITGSEGSTLFVVVPNLLLSLESTVSVKLNSITRSFENKFVLLVPEISSFSPSIAYSGQIVTIYGNNFHRQASLNIVKFDEAVATVLEASPTILVVSAPNIITQQATITVSVSGQVATAQETIEILGEPWVQIDDFPRGNIFSAGTFTIGNFGYVGLGTDIHHDYSSKVYKYSPVASGWSEIATFPGATRINPYGFALNGKGYLGGGHDLDAPWRVQLYDFYCYNPSDNSWTSIPDFPGTAAAENYIGISETVGQKHYLYLDQDAFYSLSGDPLAWTKIEGSCPSINAGSFSFVISDIIYIIDDITNSVWAYNTVENTWEQKSDFPGAPRWNGVSFSKGDYGYMGLGKDNTRYYTDIWIYSPVSDEWAKISDIPGKGRVLSFSFEAEGDIYIGGGLNDTGLAISSVYLFHTEGFK